MSSRSAPDFSLTPDLVDYIEQCVASGRYCNASEVVREALLAHCSECRRDDGARADLAAPEPFESDALFRTIFEHAAVGIAVAQPVPDGVFLRTNAWMCGIMGYEPGELVGQQYIDLTWPEDREATAAHFATLLSGERKAFTNEKRCLRKDGSAVWVIVSVARVDRADGSPHFLVAVLRDITERKRAEAALQRNEAQLRLLADAVPVHLIHLDRDLRFLFANGSYVRHFGLQGQSIAGRDLRDVIGEERFAFVEPTVRHVLAGNRAQVEFELPREDGTVMHWLAGYVPDRESCEGGAVRGLVAAFTDVTASWRAERALAESEARFRSLIDAMPQLAFTNGPDGETVFHNRRWEEYTGLPMSAGAGRRWLEAVHPDDRERNLAAWRESLATGREMEVERRLRAADGSYTWFLTRAVPLRDPETGAITRWFGTSTDISDIVAAQEALTRSRDELERLVEERSRELQSAQLHLAHAQRMQALGQLAGGIAHDFNNVIQAVQGCAALIERKPDDADWARSLARTITQAAVRGAAVTRRLLAFSRRGDLRTEDVEVAALFGALAEILSHTLGAGIDVQMKLDAGLPPLLADKGQLETVLVNLATNARDAMDGIGTLQISAARAEAGEMAELGEGSFIRLTVGDSGHGMTPEVLARASEPFFTTKPVGEGTGLGLAMARGFAEQSGGALRIVSGPGAGTAVEIWLPAASGELRVEAPAVCERPGPQQPCLLLVDDDRLVLETLAAQMEAEGFRVATARSGAEALAALHRGARFDVLISDLAMPGMSGLALVQEAQARQPGLPAILLTGFASDAEEATFGRALSGRYSVLRKPVLAQELAQLVAVMLEAL